jgi:hypothetical protein
MRSSQPITRALLDISHKFCLDARKQASERGLNALRLSFVNKLKLRDFQLAKRFTVSGAEACPFRTWATPELPA